MARWHGNPMRRPRRCTGCRAVSYCGRQDGDGRAACQHKAWGGHKKACKRARRRAEREKAAEEAVEEADATLREAEEKEARAAAAKVAKAKKQAARKKEQKRRKKQAASKASAQ